MHANSIAAYESLDISNREQQVLAALDRLGGLATDRAIALEMGSQDPGKSRPRITHLIDIKVLREAGTIIDPDTRRPVRQVERVK